MDKKVGIILFIVVALVIMTIVLLSTSLKKLASKEMGLQYNVVEKELSDEVFTEGLHAGPPGYEFIIFPNIFTSMNFEDFSCFNNEGVKIKLHITFQYRVQMANLKKVVLLFKDFDKYEDVLIREGFAGFHEACSKFNTTQFQAERGQFEAELESIISARYSKLYCDVEGMQVNNIERPKKYEDAIKSIESAKEDIEVARKEWPRQRTEAETELEEAKVEANIILTKAASEARILNQQAEKRAETILEQYSKEAEAYEAVMGASGLGLSPEAFISYMGVRVIADAKNPVYIGLNGPAKTSYIKP